MSKGTTVLSVQLEIAGVLQCTLQVKRRPLYLRFVRRPNRSGRCSRTAYQWDALDQLDDTPDPAEEIIVAACVGKTSAHFDMVKDGRRVGVWETIYHYHPIENQPPDDVLRDTAKWVDWASTR